MQTTIGGEEESQERGTEGRGACAVTNVVGLAGELRPRLDLQHAGTREQLLGLSVGSTLVYLRSSVTAEAIAEGGRTRRRRCGRFCSPR